MIDIVVFLYRTGHAQIGSEVQLPHEGERDALCVLLESIVSMNTSEML